MARLAKDSYNRKKPWKAEIKVNYQTRFIGYFHTKIAAEQAERELRQRLTGRASPMIGGPARW